MVIVDYSRCAYCGGCISVCPVEAFTLAETRLLVDTDCIDCGDCVRACPMGALGPEEAAFASHAKYSRQTYDLVVVGAGPAGATAARVAARAGLSVLLLEKRQEIGSPVRCAEGVGHDQLVSFIQPDPRWIAAEVNKAEITAIAGGQSRTIQGQGGRGYILERRVFDRVLAEWAAEAGAEVRVKTAATGLLFGECVGGQGGNCSNAVVRGVRIERGELFTGARQVDVEARLVIAADGVEAQVGRWAGLDTQLLLVDTMACVQYLLAGLEIDPTCTCYTICETLAPGGYVWIFPKGEGKANVGLGVQANLRKEEQPPLKLLDRFIQDRPFLSRGYPVTLVVGNVPVGLPPSPMVANGLMLVGDAARQVDPLTGGGTFNAMSAGQMAAEVAIAAIAAGDTSIAFLKRYEDRWHRGIGRRMHRNYRLREKFPPDKRTDERFLRAFALAVAG